MQISEIIIKGCSSEIRSVTGQLMGDWFSSFRLRFSRCSTDGNNVEFRNDFEERGGDTRADPIFHRFVFARYSICGIQLDVLTKSCAKLLF